MPYWKTEEFLYLVEILCFENFTLWVWLNTQYNLFIEFMLGHRPKGLEFSTILNKININIFRKICLYKCAVFWRYTRAVLRCYFTHMRSFINWIQEMSSNCFSMITSKIWQWLVALMVRYWVILFLHFLFTQNSNNLISIFYSDIMHPYSLYHV